MTKENFTAVYEEYADSVYRLSLFLTGQREDAEDIMQQTFLKLYREDPDFQISEQRKAWLLKTARNAAYDLLKNANRRKTVSENSGDSDTEKRAFPEPKQSTFQEPEEVISDDQTLLKGLSEKYRAPLYLFYYEEYSTGEIAEILKLSEVTVRARLSRGRKQLEKMLGGKKDGNFDL